MKKLAIMFVMLLGSVATMQAQSSVDPTFDFSCSEAIDLADYSDTNFDSVEEIQSILDMGFVLSMDGAEFEAIINETQFVFAKPYDNEDTVEFSLAPGTNFEWDHDNLASALAEIARYLQSS